MQGTPGLLTFADIGSGPVRQGFTSSNGRVFFVSGFDLYEVMSDGTYENRGTLLTDRTNVTVDEDLNTLALCDGEDLYSFEYSTNTFTRINGGGLPSSVGQVSNIDGYFVVNENDSGRFYISSINDITSWNALDFATAESMPTSITAPAIL